jgi:hypothetical protein
LSRNPHLREGFIGHIGIARARHHLERQWWLSPLDNLVLGRGIVLDITETSFRDGGGAGAEATRGRIAEAMITMTMMIVTDGITPADVMNDRQLVSGVLRGHLFVATLTSPSPGAVTDDVKATRTHIGSHYHRLAHHDVHTVLLLLVLDLIALGDEAGATVLLCLSIKANTADDRIDDQP